MTIFQAARLREQAEEWPRGGQDWPIDREEKQADALLRAALGENYERELLNGEE